MDWQDLFVAIVVIVAIGVAIRYFWGVFQKDKGGCSSCCSTQCPMKKRNTDKKINKD